MKKVLVLNTCNGFESQNPLATLIEIPKDWTIEKLEKAEQKQIGVYRFGGNLIELLTSEKIPYSILNKGKKSDFLSTIYDEEYTLISGNY